MINHEQEHHTKQNLNEYYKKAAVFTLLILTKMGAVKCIYSGSLNKMCFLTNHIIGNPNAHTVNMITTLNGMYYLLNETINSSGRVNRGNQY